MSLAASAILSAFLAWSHFGHEPPGCGFAGTCHGLEATAWGRIPALEWPVSFLGLSYFLAMFAAWVAGADRGMTRPGAVAPLAWIARLGAAVSILFIAAMVSLGRVCPYCLGAHIANLAFASVLEGSRRMRPEKRRASNSNARARRGLAIFTVVFILSTLVLAIADGRHRAGAASRAESERRTSTARIVGQGATSTAIVTPPADPWGANGFTGRYRQGPESAAIRIVALTDYQCPDCRRVEGEIEQLVTAHPDISFAVKHFPMCHDAAPGVVCNRASPSNVHPNACWAARAAEAAGILKGEAGFWSMHRWLFSRGGSFTDRELTTGLTSLGFEPAAFTAVMSGDEPLRRVRADIEEGLALGLHYTPMVFVNGVEFRGWQTPGALTRTVKEVRASHPLSRTASGDRPALAADKYVEDWREQPRRAIPAGRNPHSLGHGGHAEVVLFGDYLEANSAAMDRAIRAEVARDPQVRYVFRHYPIDPECNHELPAALRPEAVHRGACRAARAAEAAAVLGGEAAFWKVHAWFMEHGAAGDDALQGAARAAGLDPAALAARLADPGVSSTIEADTRAARELGLGSLPMVFVDGRWVPRTMREQENVVVRILRMGSR